MNYYVKVNGILPKVFDYLFNWLTRLRCHCHINTASHLALSRLMGYAQRSSITCSTDAAASFLSFKVDGAPPQRSSITCSHCSHTRVLLPKQTESHRYIDHVAHTRPFRQPALRPLTIIDVKPLYHSVDLSDCWNSDISIRIDLIVSRLQLLISKSSFIILLLTAAYARAPILRSHRDTWHPYGWGMQGPESQSNLGIWWMVTASSVGQTTLDECHL